MTMKPRLAAEGRTNMLHELVKGGGTVHRSTSLFWKYFFVLFSAVLVPLLGNGATEAWFGYRDQRLQLDQFLNVEARAAASRIESFITGIKGQLEWMVQLPWAEANEVRQELDAARLMRQVPAISELRLIDGDGRERLYISRIGLNRAGSRIDQSDDPAVRTARAARTWYGPVTYHLGSEPVMMIAVAGNRRAVGVAVATINLKLIWDVISAIHVGEAGRAFVLDRLGRLIAHPDLSLVLRGEADPAARPLALLREAVSEARGATVGRDLAGSAVIAANAHIPGVDWSVVVQQPVSEAFAPIERALRRTGVLLLVGAAFSAGLAFWLARRMTGPIRLLERGTQQIGAGRFEHRIPVVSNDELGRLAQGFNAMAVELSLARDREERISRLKRFLSPQVAELVDRTGDDRLLNGRRLPVAAVFGDLRNFTPFSERTSPEVVMRVLDQYHLAVGAVITRHGATITSFAGDGFMVLVNAPVACFDPCGVTVRLALDLQDAVRPLVLEWTRRDYAIGFGIGAAFGPATVGRIGFEGRFDYTAIGPVVNLAARLCAAAQDGQCLVDPSLLASARNQAEVSSVGSRTLKGFNAKLQIFSIARPSEGHEGRISHSD